MSGTLEMLGYAPGDRVLITHADDVGFSHASNVASFECMLEGSLTCGSTLVSAPWFMETVALQKEHPDADIGIHMTLTAEYERYRWRSLTGGSGSALHAPDGGMWRDVASVLTHVSEDEGRRELRAQIEHALAMGIDVTHIDTHMGTVIHPKFLPAYVDLAIEFRLPLFLVRPSERRVEALGEGAAAYQAQIDRLDALGWPVLDSIIHRTLSEIAPEEKEATFKRMFAELRPGLTHFLVHPAVGGPELDAMAPVDCRHRAGDYAVFRTPMMREYCESLGIKLTGYREVRDRLRAALPASK
ncbi:MAG TPA: polysaccharide deacetylase family protein [Dehalococcoidia bacterium]|nr:polysaccharide deacetylase family protein [Dehalococcoidia bacterium]